MMSLFNFGKKKEEKKTSACACGCPKNETEEAANRSHSEAKDGTCSVKVLGAGCKSCHQQYENARQAVKDMGIFAEVAYITEMSKVIEYGVMSMPAIVVNEKVVATGKVLKANEIIALLHHLGF